MRKIKKSQVFLLFLIAVYLVVLVVFVMKVEVVADTSDLPVNMSVEQIVYPFPDLCAGIGSGIEIDINSIPIVEKPVDDFVELVDAQDALPVLNLEPVADTGLPEQETVTEEIVTEETVLEIPPVEFPVFDPSLVISSNPELGAYLMANSSLLYMTDDFVSLCAAIHLEAGYAAAMDSKMAVGNVIVNRLRNTDVWHYSTLNDVIFAEDQFSVVNHKSFNKTKEKIMSNVWDADLQNSITAAYLVITGSQLIPADVCYFCGNENRRTWGSHTYCFTLGGNSYFK